MKTILNNKRTSGGITIPDLVQVSLQQLLLIENIMVLYPSPHLLCQRSSDHLWFHFWFFSSIPFIYLFISVLRPYHFYHNCSVVQLEVRDYGSTRSSFLVEKNICYPWFLLFQMNLQIVLSKSVKNWVGILMRIALNL